MRCLLETRVGTMSGGTFRAGVRRGRESPGTDEHLLRAPVHSWPQTLWRLVLAEAYGSLFRIILSNAKNKSI